MLKFKVDPETVWFTADHHFGHHAIIDYAKRPFSDVDEMDAELIRRWNSRVAPQDTVFHLGDFSLSNSVSTIERYARQLNGHIQLIYGNHDHRKTRQAKGFMWRGPLREIRLGDQEIVLCHYAMRVWNKLHHGSWMLYGHSHGSLPLDKTVKSMDVGVDVHDYYPLRFSEVATLLADHGAQPVDHHRPYRLARRDKGQGPDV